MQLSDSHAVQALYKDVSLAHVLAIWHPALCSWGQLLLLCSQQTVHQCSKLNVCLWQPEQRAIMPHKLVLAIVHLVAGK